MSTNHIIGQPSAPTLSAEASQATTTTARLDIPPGYRRAVQFGAIWALITSPYSILYLIVILAIGGPTISWEDIGQVLEFAGTSPVAFGATVLLDGLSHVLFVVPAVTLFAVLRARWPVQASLVLVCGAWQMITGFTKALSSLYTFTSLGDAYVAGDAALRAALIPAAMAADGLRQALQQMDSFGVAVIWVIISLSPRESGLPRPVRWLGWILAFALLGPDPGFLLVILLDPVWLFLLGRWLKRLPTADESIG
jgi:hypothetical protein